jgi:hypothetical protein
MVQYYTFKKANNTVKKLLTFYYRLYDTGYLIFNFLLENVNVDCQV